MTEIFDTILIHPIINALVFIYKTLLSAGIPYTLGISIIVLTAIIKLITYPLTSVQLKSAAQIQKLKPHMDKIKEQHKNDKTRLQQETMRLYKEHNINPAAGCLPLLIQLPIFIALYNVLMRIVNTNTDDGVRGINDILYSNALRLDKPWDPNFFGVSLSATPSNWTELTPALLLIPVITAGLQFVQSKMMLPKDENKEKVHKEQKKEVVKPKEDDFQKALQTQMTYFLPVMIGIFSYSFPVGLSLYWNVFTLFGIMQQYLIQRK